MTRLIALATLLLVPCLAIAKTVRPAELEKYEIGFEHIGSGSVGFLFWRFFDAELWGNKGGFDWDSPLALSLTYRTDFTARDLTDSTLEEMARINGWPERRLADFRAEIAPCMANVKPGDRFTAASPHPDRVVLYFNGVRLCELAMPNIRRAYLGIWLSSDSRFPEQSRRLTGGARW